MRQNGGGSIVNVSAIAGLRGGPGQTAYSASQGAIVASSQALAVELADSGIRANCLCPGGLTRPSTSRPSRSWVDGSGRTP